MAECYFLKAKYDLAIENYLKAISLSGGRMLWWEVALGRAYSYQKEGSIKALPYLEKGLQMKKEHMSSVYYTIGLCYANVGDYKKAEEYYQKSLELNTGCIQIGSYSQILTVQLKYSEAFQFLDSVCSEQSCEMICHKYKFYTHLALKEFDQAEQQINQLSEVGGTFNLGDRFWYPYYIGDSILLAYMYKELGKEHEALPILNNSRKYLESQLAENQTWFTYLFLSYIHAILDEKADALKYLSEAGELGFQEGFHDFIEIHPIFENLRDDPEFVAIVKRAQDEKTAVRDQIRKMEERGEIDL
jgi:tetratricopeptide (TPR) repeat protein